MSKPDPSEDAIWYCKIGPASRGDLPSGSDAPMREAVEAAFRKLTGHDPEFTFSGWGADLTEAERAVVEGRLPRPAVIAAAARKQMEQAEAVIGTDLDPDPSPTSEGRPHRCGPTTEQIMDAHLRGDVIGSYPMCDECAAADAALFARVKFIDPANAHASPVADPVPSPPKRLNEDPTLPERLRWAQVNVPGLHWSVTALLSEAADEIDRLLAAQEASR